MQSSQEAAVSVRMQSTKSGQLSRRIGDELEKALLSPSAEIEAGRFMETTAERDNLLLRPNNYKT